VRSQGTPDGRRGSPGGFGGDMGGPGNRGAQRRNAAVGGSYIVFALRAGKPTPVVIQTGLTDQDHIEVTGGLAEGDTVLVLPSASLVSGQRDMRERTQRMTGGGLPGLQQQPSGGQRVQIQTRP
jgi:hypothetical protein